MNSYNSMQDHPPLSFFDRAFKDNPGDALFCSLNEIQPMLLEDESLLDDEFTQPQVVDPRNNLPVTQPLYDYSVPSKPDLFRCSHRSLLTKREHSTCVAFLQALKAKLQIYPHQLQCFEETSARRKTEKADFLQFLQQYNKANYEKIYAPDLMFVGLYRRFYKLEAKQLMQKHHDGVFQIQTGFPLPRSCGNSDMYGRVSEVKVLSSSESMRVMDTYVDLSKIRTRIDKYFVASIKEAAEDQRAPVYSVQYEISTEALVFLLCAGEYIDIPAEVMVIAVENDDGECVIQINDPLPTRNTGVHTTELVVSKATEVFLELCKNKVVEEIQASEFTGPYSLQTFEDFTDRRSNACSKEGCSNLVQWNLEIEDGEKRIPIITRTKSGYREAHGKEQVYYSLKLEFKPKFGCEIPTKVTLIREWIEQLLCNAQHSSTNRHRINASTFTTILHENLSIDDIEQQLERHYQVKIPRLLGSLGDFLGLLAKVTPGRYLLRYNPRFQDKLILYGEVKVASTKTCVNLHSLLQEEPSDMAFMTLRQLASIDDRLCTAMHDFYQLLPCAFPPWRTLANKIIDDRKFILRKIQEKTNVVDAKKNKVLQRRKHIKRLKKAKKSKIKTQQKQQEKKDMQELEKDINHDRLLYGFKATEAD